ncbi:GntR family transcriptional regulator [Streptomyces poonensis]|uniref:GntR family transcriptional regulator n=1 Tax=Streptomyces poonensis TaxID=68255 RepID=A0A918PB16_9ACTN|nr:GntR family transcriptional regulator [Streptomyces poonensis]GGY95958.1 GntR family transcriptional regulator [Streptomyces poonensis]GLJ88889.1 GntR family transcriptional regulator [Streptomyces poonensis]
MTQEYVEVNGSGRRSPREIADALRERIRTGELKTGERLPTQAELAERYGVERGAVRQALRLLQRDGLLSNVSRGRPPEIAAPDRGPAEPQPATVMLSEHLRKACAAAHARIDAVCFTAETLMEAMHAVRLHTQAGRLRPESIEMRCLLPDPGLAPAFPVPVDGDEGKTAEIRRSLAAQRTSQARVLDLTMRRIRAESGIDARVSFRLLPFTPPVKLFVLNDREALLGHYQVARHTKQLPGGEIEVYDAWGKQSLLFRFERDAGGRDAAFVEQSRKWFDALWATIARESTLT